MAIGNGPAMFVSSTCYDLREVRASLQSFIQSLGIRPFLSEYPSFPVNPDLKAVENCLEVVDQFADIFLLVVGGRYGSITEQDKSITNMEYLRARAKGIPIYVFVQKSILSILPVWKNNPDADYSNVVDSNRLFEFVTSLTDTSNVWVFSFELAQDIVGTLREQLGYLFMSALTVRQKFQASELPESLRHLRGEALRLAIERPSSWEVRLFARVLADEALCIWESKSDLQYQIAFGESERLETDLDVISWLRGKMAEAKRIVAAATTIVNMAFPEAMSPDGVPGNPQGLVYCARRLANVYEQTIEWKTRCRRITVKDEKFEKVIEIIGSLLDDSRLMIENFAITLVDDIGRAVAAPTRPDKPLEFSLVFTLSNSEELDAELDRLFP